MKVRMDFVTNSSSSSYIFKDKEEFEKTKKIDWAEIRPFKEHKQEDLQEVFEWYKNKIYENIFGEEVDEENPAEHILEKVAENLRSITMMLMFLCVTEKWFGCAYNSSSGRLLQEEFERYIWDVLSNPSFLFDAVLEYAVCNYCIKIVELSKDYETMHIGDMLSELFGAKYMYFSELETYMEEDAWFRSIKDCIYACNHMG